MLVNPEKFDKVLGVCFVGGVELCCELGGLRDDVGRVPSAELEARSIAHAEGR